MKQRNWRELPPSGAPGRLLEVHGRGSIGDHAVDVREFGPGEALEIRVTGVVQGVGFRPTVWRLATQERLVGEVRNDGEGVLIRAAGPADALARFLRRLEAEAPPLARIERILARERALGIATFGERFEIAASVAGEAHTHVPPDAAICRACAAEILDPGARRFGHAFANCTDCGPRFSIVEALPYDRANTTMAGFEMCAACRAEYERPDDRRFHAQPIACPECGPRLWLEDFSGGLGVVEDPARALAEAAAALRAGTIVAIRGIGGFHLACDATDPAAIARLRARKRRDAKPLAIMATDVAMVRRYCSVDADEQRALEDVAAAIVVLRHDGPERLPEILAPGLPTLGFMLAYAPLHRLVLAAVGRPLVMTSGNLGDAPQITQNDEARAVLARIAELGLLHDRAIVSRVDDSLVRVIGGRPRVIRRGRGLAPGAIRLPPGFEDAPAILAVGAQQRAAFCLLGEGVAVLSQHQGDLDEPATYAEYRANLQFYAKLHDHRPRLLACDRHPGYRTTRLARARGLAVVEVQHHHAHMAGCMAEHGLARATPAVLGVILDGLGYGEDGTIWGGEWLLGDYREVRRLASLAAVALPGGERAILEPWRNLYAQIRAAFGWRAFVDRWGELEVCRRLAKAPLAILDRMIDTNLNSPIASSTGRLFDAVAAALGLCFDRVAYEAEAAMRLEALAVECADEGYPFGRRVEAGIVRLDPAPMWAALFDDLRGGRAPGSIAARFQRGLAAAIAALTVELARGRTETVILSGGCMQNAILLTQLEARLGARGLRCLSNVEVPANDGGIALGQAVVAAARSQTGHGLLNERRSDAREICR